MMKNLKQNSRISLSVILQLSILGVSYGVNGSKNEDPFALWKEQPNEKIVFMSKADSPEGELYLLDKIGQASRLTSNDRHENNPALSPDGTKVLFLKLDFIIVNDQLAGAHHRLFLMDPDGSNQEQLIPDDRHTPTLEYLDW